MTGKMGMRARGHALGIYRAAESAGFIGAVVGAIIVLLIYHRIARNK